MHPTSSQEAAAGVRPATAARKTRKVKAGPREGAGSAALLQAAARASTAVPRAGVAQPVPRSAELVENLDDGRYYLRAHQQGRYWWREVADPTQPIPGDAPAWHLDDGTLGRQYWLNHGEVRLRQGAYCRVTPAGTSTGMPP